LSFSELPPFHSLRFAPELQGNHLVPEEPAQIRAGSVKFVHTFNFKC